VQQESILNILAKERTVKERMIENRLTKLVSLKREQI
jgi:hypothetical protein